MPDDTHQKPPAPVVPLTPRRGFATAGPPPLPGPSATCWTRIAALEAQNRAELVAEGMSVTGWSFDGRVIIAAASMSEAQELAESWSCPSVTLCRIDAGGGCL